MQKISLDRGWEFQTGSYQSLIAILSGQRGSIVNLPHDFMIEGNVSENAAAGPSMGFFNGGAASYTKRLTIPAHWKNDVVLLEFDGAMMNAEVNANGHFVGLHHYGYTPFTVDLTPYLVYGEENRITVTVNTTAQPSSRWYTGSGLYRHVYLRHGSALHILPKGIYVYTKQLRKEEKHRVADIIAEVALSASVNNGIFAEAEIIDPTGKTVLCHNAPTFMGGSEPKAVFQITLHDPILWNSEHPALYKMIVKLYDKYGGLIDTEKTFIGIRTVSVSAKNGLEVNGKPVKLRGTCLHHDNGILGAVSMIDAEYRKLNNLKQAGYNAVRCAHNPPSADFLDVCDKLGIYVIDEAFDVWRQPKNVNDYHLYFDSDWKSDIEAFTKRDRSHPSVIMWSIGNEVAEQSGLGSGNDISLMLANRIRDLDSTRPITCGICSLVSSMTDSETEAMIRHLKEEYNGETDIDKIWGQNANSPYMSALWAEKTAKFASALDVIGYNYMDERYEGDHMLFPNRVIVGTESFPTHMEQAWEHTAERSYVIGDFTWIAQDYLGEAGLGRCSYLDPQAPPLPPGSMSTARSGYPWRIANAADFDICGFLTPQGAFRRIFHGSNETFLAVKDPKQYGKIEKLSSWGWPERYESWNWSGSEGKPIEVSVYSAADTVELFLNGESLGTCNAGSQNHYCAVFTVKYFPGVLEAVSYRDKTECSRKALETTLPPTTFRIKADRTEAPADGQSLVYAEIEITDSLGRRVPNAEILVYATAEGVGSLMAFGSSKVKTEENYCTGQFTSCRGRLLAVLRTGYQPGEICLKLRASGISDANLIIQAVSPICTELSETEKELLEVNQNAI